MQFAPNLEKNFGVKFYKICLNIKNTLVVKPDLESAVIKFKVENTIAFYF